MNKTVKIIQRTLVGMVFVILLVLFSEKVHQLTKDKITSICLYVIPTLLLMYFSVDILDRVVELERENFASKAQKLWNNIKKNVRPNIIHYIDTNEDEIFIPPVSVMGQLMTIYRYDMEIFDKLLEKVVKVYETDDSTHAILTYVLLENCSHNEVAMLFEERVDLKQYCEYISREIADSAICNFNSETGVLTERRLKELFVGLLHSCLPNNSISRNETVCLLRYILNWILESVSTKNINEYEEIMSIFVLVLPAIKRKLQESNINDDEINNNLKEIENSRWFKQLVYESYKFIETCLDKDEMDFLQIEKYIRHVCVLCIYHDKMTLKNQKKLYHRIKDKKRQNYKHLEKIDDKAVLFLLSASPMQMFKNDGDLMYKLATIVCLCASQLI